MSAPTTFQPGTTPITHTQPGHRSLIRMADTDVSLLTSIACTIMSVAVGILFDKPVIYITCGILGALAASSHIRAQIKNEKIQQKFQEILQQHTPNNNNNNADSLSIANKEVVRLKEENQKLQAVNTSREKELQRLTEQLKTKQEELQQQQTRITALQGERDQVMMKAMEDTLGFKVEITKLETKIDGLEAKVGVLEPQVGSLEKRRDELMNEIANLKKQISDIKDFERKLEGVSLEAKMSKNIERYNNLQSLMAELVQKINGLEQIIKQKEEHLVQLDKTPAGVKA